MRKTLAILLRRIADRLWTSAETPPVSAVESESNNWTWTPAGYVIHFEPSAAAEQIKEIRRRMFLAE